MKNVSIYYPLGFILTLFIMASCSNASNNGFIKTQVLNENWRIQSQNQVNLGGDVLSTKEYSMDAWTPIELPSTVFNGLLKAKVYQDIFVGDNLDKIDAQPFKQAWWYRSEFSVEDKSLNQYFDLLFEGINYRANIWLNGILVADSAKIEGPFGRWNLPVSKHIVKGKNVLAVQIFPAAHDDLTIGFVDWNPAAPDNNMGIWRPVKLLTHGAVSVQAPFVKSKVNTQTLNSAALTIVSALKNHSNQRQSFTLSYAFDNKIISKQLELMPHEAKDIAFTSDEFPELTMDKPKLWWPNLMGEPNLYALKASVSINKTLSDVCESRFGIRQIDDYWTQDQHRGYKINGKKILIKGAGWVDDILLADSDEKVAAQVAYVKQMNMNCIRLEGFWGKNKTLYDKADEMGLLVMVGWSCHWEWEGYCGRPDDNYMAIRTPEDQELQARAYQDQVLWLRNHASVFLWVYGSDKLPLPELEEKLNHYIGAVDDSRPVLASCKYADFDIVRNEKGEVKGGYVNNSRISGPTGVKMLGPYAYTAPKYWYVDKNAGGAYGFNTETGPGAQVPPLESIKKMLPADKLWPMNELWDFHSGRNEFATLWRDVEAFNARYGEAQNVEEFAFNMQMHNYEAIRAMYEAFEVNKHNTTGIIQWMLNSAWPEMFWQLYDWYLLPNGAFYGTQKANQPLNIIYNYGTGNVHVSNSYLRSFNDLLATIKVYDINSNVVFEKNLSLSIDENSSKALFTMPELKALSETYFIDLRINDKIGNALATNFYWLSTKPDVFNWKKSVWFYTPYKSYASFSALHTMPKAKVNYTFSDEVDANGDRIFSCALENETDKIAFFIEMAILDAATDETIVPVFWDDNYVTLLPGEKRIVNARLQKDELKNKELKYRVKSFNQAN